jgi:hypothetical protein
MRGKEGKEEGLCRGWRAKLRTVSPLYQSALHCSPWCPRYRVLDEVDRMMAMGFIEDVETILKAEEGHQELIQTFLFSATMPKWIKDLCNRFLKKGHKIVDLIGDSQAVQVSLPAGSKAIGQRGRRRMDRRGPRSSSLPSTPCREPPPQFGT